MRRYATPALALAVIGLLVIVATLMFSIKQKTDAANVAGKRYAQASEQLQKTRAGLELRTFGPKSTPEHVAGSFVANGFTPGEVTLVWAQQNPDGSLGQIVVDDPSLRALAGTEEAYQKAVKQLTDGGAVLIENQCASMEAADGTWAAGYCTYRPVDSSKAL